MNDMELWMQMTEQSKRKTILVNDGQKEIMDSDNYGGRPVIGKIVVLSRSLAEEFECDKEWACISIADAYLDQPHPALLPKHLLKLQFDDIEFERPGKKQIDAKQAKQIRQFVEEIWDQVDLLMIHCNAGISRSAAIAKIISECYQPDFTYIFDQLYQPNPIVQQIVRKVFERKKK